MESSKKEITEQLVKLDINNLIECINEVSETKPGLQKKFEKFVQTISNKNRLKSSIIQLRDFHNFIKRSLITAIVGISRNKNIYLLDIAVGRGGDLDKWYKAGIKGVFGFDLNNDSINSIDPFNPGAQKRLETYRSSAEFKNNVLFTQGNVMNPSSDLINQIVTYRTEHSITGFNIVSCQFALHYFFNQASDLKTVIMFISKCLVKGGYFIGTTINGDKIRNLFKQTSSFHINGGLYDIFIDKKFTSSPYSNQYKFRINDAGDKGNYFNTTGISTEYLVSFKELIAVCGTFGLVPVTKNYLEPYKNGKEFTETVAPGRPNPLPNIYNFNDVLRIGNWVPKSNVPLKPEEISLNDLYSAFVFQKIV